MYHGTTLVSRNAFFDSFGPDSIWMQDPPPTGDEAVTYFFDDVIGMSTLPDTGDRRPTRLVGKNVGYSFFAWLIIYVSILCVCVLRSNYSSRSLFAFILRCNSAFPIHLLFSELLSFASLGVSHNESS